LHLVTKDTYMAGAWQFEQKLNAEIPSSSTPVAWSSSQLGPAPGFFFPNTWMAFAKPLARSYGYDVRNLRGRPSDFAPDVVLDGPTLTELAVCAPDTGILVFETQNGGLPLDKRVVVSGISLHYQGEQTSHISLLSQPPTNGDWTHAAITVKAWLVRADAAQLANGCSQ
jgi:hypothetical protein